MKGDAADLQAFKRALQQLCRRYPNEHVRVIEELLDGVSKPARARIDKNWRSLFPPKKGKERVLREHLVVLLAIYRGWQHAWPGPSKRGCRAQFLARIAENGGLHYRTAYSRGVWNTAGAVDKQLKAATARAKTDQGFSQKVDLCLGAVLTGDIRNVLSIRTGEDIE